ncbi:carbohydrate-binding protein [Actinoplanes derwentensis]|uniref:carbohydrate-binding protein n=1 Tax=Actinoplanes derwentensis TaxID=113562 RepID=UPI002F91427B
MRHASSTCVDAACRWGAGGEWGCAGVPVQQGGGRRLLPTIWAEGVTCTAGHQVTCQSTLYQALVTHTARAGTGWNPAATPTPWTSLAPAPAEIRPPPVRRRPRPPPRRRRHRPTRPAAA